MISNTEKTLLRKKIYWAGGKCKPPRYRIRTRMTNSGWKMLHARWGLTADHSILKHLFSMKPKFWLIQGGKR